MRKWGFGPDHQTLKIRAYQMPIQLISLTGTPDEIGYQHGQLLREQIHQNIEFYQSVFLKNLRDKSQILQAARRYQEAIQAYNPNFNLEIDHIAIGAGVSEPLWLYALNARTELSMVGDIQECTAVVCPKAGLIGQTWDWAEKLEEKFFLMEISFPDGHQILQVSEAGIIGKIGMNNQGLGVTLNFLYDPNINVSTVPIHILLRQVLECRSLEEAKDAAQRSGIGKASNLIIAQSSQASDIEFAGDVMKIHEISDDYYVHTNHCMHAKPPDNLEEDVLLNSTTRRNTALRILENSSSYQPKTLMDVFSDQSNDTKSILAKYKPDPDGLLGEIGTLATIIMNLVEQTMFVRIGNPDNAKFSIEDYAHYYLR
jgi:isopenicillin-N N-acyltransferase-like protein